jgi:hypothetical protein
MLTGGEIHREGEFSPDCYHGARDICAGYRTQVPGINEEENGL